MGLRRWPRLIAESCLQLQKPIIRRRCSGLPVLQCQLLQPLSTQHGDSKVKVAVIGGGLTGLTAAFHCANADVTLYEKSTQLGGWMQSESIETSDGKVLFEYGPRTLRSKIPEALPTLELISQLELRDSLLLTSKDSPASYNRYIYHPDHLVLLPGSSPGGVSLERILRVFLSLLTEPALKGLLMGLLKEPFQEARDTRVKDESIGEFLTRRIGKEPTDNLASAVFHGIYAGDIYKLSAATILPALWDYEWEAGSIAGGFSAESGKPASYMYNLTKALKSLQKDYPTDRVAPLASLVAGSKVFSLKEGLGSVAAKLEEMLSKRAGTKIIKEADITHIQDDKSGQSMTVVCSDGSTENYDYVISTTPSVALAKQLRGPGQCTPPTATTRLLASNNYAVNVMVVNLFYHETDLVPVQGFGYLIPRTIPVEQNPERALGVLFMSDAVTGQDTAKGTKLAVMLGGHWWDGWQESDFPNEEEAIDMAKSVLARHLGIGREPAVARARMLRDAIPQPKVGHRGRMEELHNSLTSEYDSRLKVAGAWYTGAGVNNCVTGAQAVAMSINNESYVETGLEDYIHPRGTVA